MKIKIGHVTVAVATVLIRWESEYQELRKVCSAWATDVKIARTDFEPVSVET